MLQRRKNVITDEDYFNIVTFYKEGMPVKDIMAKVGCSRATIYSYLNLNNQKPINLHVEKTHETFLDQNIDESDDYFVLKEAINYVNKNKNESELEEKKIKEYIGEKCQQLQH